MTQLTVFANIESKEEHSDFLKEELTKLLNETRNSEGCTQSRLEQDKTNPNLFKLYEYWESRESWHNSRNNRSIERFLEVTSTSTKSFMLNEMTILI